jgi:ribosomal protein L37AE/L43A
MGLISGILAFLREKPNHSVSSSNERSVPIVENPITINTITEAPERIIPEVFICRTCGKTFATESDLLNHKSRKYSDDISFENDVDSSISKNPDSSGTNITNPQILNYNQILESEKQSGFLCKVCGRSFTTREERENHIHLSGEILAFPDSPNDTVRPENSLDTRFVNNGKVGVTNMGSERLRYDKFPGKIGYIRKK